jgi:hypothetical protein
VGIRDAVAAPPPVKATKPNLPKGWEPGIRWSNEKGEGTVVTGDLTQEPDAAIWREILNDWGDEAQRLEIVDGSIELVGWDAMTGKDRGNEVVRMKRYRAKLRKRQDDENAPDVEALCERLMKRTKPPKAKPSDAERSLLILLSDLQAGKGEGGGTDALIDRLEWCFGEIVAHVRELARVKRPVGCVYLVGLGDLVEQCVGHYPGQTFTVDLNRRDQMRIVRRVIIRLVDLLVDEVPRVVVTGVPGNHGENRLNGKAFTDVADNDDLAVIEQAGVAFDSNQDRYGAVSLFLPGDLSMALDVCGVPVGFAHGHQAGGGTHPAAKIEKWWSGQIVGGEPVADARILFTGHYHHFLCSESIGRTHFQVPAMDGGSAWWRYRTGQTAPPGMLVVSIGEAYGPRGWGDHLLLSPPPALDLAA